MLPGKKYSPEDFLRIAWTRRWMIVIPTLLIAGATFAVALTLQNRYKASTLILVVPQRVPENYVRPTVTTQIDDRLQMISQQILSRTRLERIMQEFDLYEGERERLIMEDVIELMRRDISISIGARRGANRDQASNFTVSYEAPSARMAMLVTERVASLFVQENLEDRELLAESTSQFLQAQLEDAKRRLQEHEKKLEGFRQRNNGQLPTQVLSNLQMMQNTQMQLQTLSESFNRDRDRLLVLERNLTDALSDAAPVLVASPAPSISEAGVPMGTAAQQLEMAKTALRGLELRLKPEHPDVGRARRVIAELEDKAEAEALQQPLSNVSATPSAPVSVADRNALARVNAMRIEIEELRQRLNTRKQEEARLQALSGSFAAKIQVAPSLESELTELMRDYETLQEAYTSLLKRSEESKIAVNLERRQIGEQFKILDGARLPERPISPDRVRINLMGLLAGLGLSLGFVALLEYRDTTLKTDEDVVTTLALPVLAVIPAMVTAAERRRLKRRRLVLASSASVVGLVAVAAVAAWRLRLLDAWIR